MMGNAMMNRSFDQYSYKRYFQKAHIKSMAKILCQDNLYDVVPKGMNKRL